MKKGWKITLIIGFILLIGGGVSYAMGFNKDYFDYLGRKNYTGKFTSSIEGNDSYVLYKARNQQFSIKLPKDFIILEETHGIGSDTHEIFNAAYWNPETKDNGKSIGRRLKVNYDLLPQEEVDIATKIALETYSFENQYQKHETDDLILYTGESHTDASGMEVKRLDAKEYGTNTFFGFVLEKESNHSIEIGYSLICLEDDKEKCDYNEELEREIFKNLIESITFTGK